MAPAVKKPLNVFKLGNTGLPPQVFNWRLWFAVVNFGLLGAARGLDEGLITGVFNSKGFQELLHLGNYSKAEQANIKGNVSAMTLIGCVPGSIIAYFACDRIGRLWTVREVCLVWLIGITIFMANQGHLGAVYAGRFIVGLGMGQIPVVGPIYIAEVAPAPIRGLCTCSSTALGYLILVIAYFANYGARLHLNGTNAQWVSLNITEPPLFTTAKYPLQQIPNSLNFIFAGVILLMSFFQTETPRFYVKQGKPGLAVKAMARFRNLPPDDPYVLEEMSAVQSHWLAESETTKGQGAIGLAKEIFLVPSNLYRLYIGVMGQILSQWSGAGSITLYAVDLFNVVGVRGQEESLLISAVYGIVKFIAALICLLFLVDVVGRKRSLLAGITLQAISMIYVAAFLSSTPQLGVDKHFEVPASKRGASLAAIVMIFFSGFGWALGWSSMQYLLTAELFPLRIRAACTSLIMVAHFANQYGNGRAVPNMLLPLGEGGINPSGTFWTFAAVTVAGGIWVVFTIPETAGRTLESMDRLFQLPWYKIGLRGNDDAAMRDEAETREEKVVT
ncbi:hypothetical protein JDV02_010375 [Purpureocillium takamizusanense]|uniref:Major facilitator superfamily (MFS) profile domain-containing protein n=1 Tax=Purpureocillium takamizusanense TaxID=2060973 RepID=A0A9Q8QSK7_9HYPO|nr:uncharacterized protein JDV02_010375 [Purpureocillium takamizusanense]UNI24642.1 hypothetical protein JDV02_010375 [Purpureocillium takamizusanense]